MVLVKCFSCITEDDDDLTLKCCMCLNKAIKPSLKLKSLQVVTVVQGGFGTEKRKHTVHEHSTDAEQK